MYNASNTYVIRYFREGPIVAGVQVSVDECASDAVKGGGVVGILEVLGERSLPRLTGGWQFNSIKKYLQAVKQFVEQTCWYIICTCSVAPQVTHT